MDALLLRQLWGLIEAAQTSILLTLDDSELVNWLLQQLREVRSLNPEEADAITLYTYSRLRLIRDLAESRRAPTVLRKVLV
ncbi:MAG: hypothetical protein F6K19_28715 [Cyanothece sp. SIO1E1]|nr:hypothetical protein [Cyanothece sp. SIO1E1]